MVQDVSFAPLETPLALPIKRYNRELQLIAVNKLLSEVYGRAIQIHELLLLDLDRAKVTQLEYFGLQSVAETFVERLKEFLRSPISGDRNFHIVSRHFGLDGKPIERLSEIAVRLGISRERVRQLEMRSVLMLKAPNGFKFIRTTLKELAGVSYESLTVAESTMIAPAYQTQSQQVQISVNDPEVSFPDCTLSEVSLEALTQNQKRIFQELDTNRRALVGGCAGSGKTLLAVLKAKQLAASGLRTLLTCYNRPLADYLLSNIGDVPNLHVLTFHALCYRHAKSANMAVPAGKTTHIWNETFPRLLTKAVSMHPDRRYDAIVVDEGQDFHPCWWQSLESTLRNGAASRLYVFYDNNQSVINKRSYLPDLPDFELNENVRNSTTISQMVQRFYTGQKPLVAAGTPGRSIESYEYETLEELERTLDFVLERIMHEHELSVEDIVILTPRLPKFSMIKEAKLAAGLRVVFTDSRLSNRVLCSRIHTFKGLERRVVILIDLDEKFMRYSDSERDAMCYVAFSRASDHLVLMGQSDVLNEVLSHSAS